MIEAISGFLRSSVYAGDNVVKSILFRIAGLLMQFAVLRFFALIAYKMSAFTAYLMFAEDYIQRTLFIVFSKFSKGALLVLALTIFYAAGSLYDTLLWGLDAPGYLVQKSNIRASQVENQLVDAPGYVILVSDGPENLAALDTQISETIGSNLFKRGVNVTLTGRFARGIPEPVKPTRIFSTFDMTNTGPRIWLADDGWSVSPDTYATFAVPPNGDDDKAYSCPWEKVSDNATRWECKFDNKFAVELASQRWIGRPEIHWDDESEALYLSMAVRASREDNPWASLGLGGSSAVMKQVFTVAKGRRRHTFLVSALKIAVVYKWGVPFPEDDVSELVDRTGSIHNNPQPGLGRTIASKMADAVSGNNSFQLGGNRQQGNTISQFNYELLNPAPTGKALYSMFRITHMNLTHVRSEDLPRPIEPHAPCTEYYQNMAKGGKVYGTDCYSAALDEKEGGRFLGQQDTSAVLILGDLLGDHTTNVSTRALDQDAFNWVMKNNERLNNLVLSRGYIQSIDPSLVTVELSELKPAISYLQIMLVLFPVVIGAISWLSLYLFGSGHYTSSLLGNLYATTDAGRTNTSRRPQYIRRMPEIRLVDRGDQVRMETETGTFALDEARGGFYSQGYAVVAKEESLQP